MLRIQANHSNFTRVTHRSVRVAFAMFVDVFDFFAEMVKLGKNKLSLERS